MNNLSLSILTLLHYNVIIRDTLEYATKRDQFALNAYEYKKNAVMIEIKENTALKQFIDNNKETIGKKVIDEINNLYAAIYADDSTICKVSNKELRVDDSQHIAIYDVTFPLHDDISNIIASHINFARSKGASEESLIKLVHADNKMYQAVALHCLFGDLERLFVEYNKARNEAKGEITPQSNFIQQELVKIVHHINFVKERFNVPDLDYWEVNDMITCLVNQTNGRRALPAGKTFKEIFDEGRKLISAFLAKAENEWKVLYEPAINELLTISKANNGQIKVGEPNTKN